MDTQNPVDHHPEPTTEAPILLPAPDAERLAPMESPEVSDNDFEEVVRGALEAVGGTLLFKMKVGADNGLVEVNPVGQPFNPDHHQAMSMVDSDEHAAGHVVQVYQKGWLLNERLLRPALVVVSRTD